MNHFVSMKSIAAAALVLGALASTAAAHARSDVQFSISLQSPGFYVEPAPVYVQPAPVYVWPAPVYVQPAPVYYQRPQGWRGRHGGYYRDRDRDGDGRSGGHSDD